MTLETFFEQFELLADAPNGVKKLRELILQLAVQGKLVPQDSQDEPALALLERIKLNKEQLVKAKQISKDEALALIESKDVPFLLPKNWEWAYLGQISNTIHYGYTASGNHETSEVRLLRITDIQDNQVDWSMVPGCEIEPNKLKNYELKNGDILIARTGGTIGKSYLVKDISVCAVFASYLIRVVPNSLFTPRYLKLFLESPFYWKQLYSKSMGTGQPNVNATSLKSLYIPIPPLNEQQRIVEQVEHLMKMCDRLEEQQKKRRESCIRLNEGAIAQLLSASNAEESDRHWQRICNNFDLFYSLPENVGKLRQAILQLAIRGKLVPQDSDDEPALALLKRVKSERDYLAKKGKIRPLDSLPTVNLDDCSCTLPSGWLYVRLGAVIELISGQHLGQDEQNSRNEGLPYLTGPADFGEINPTATRWTTTLKTIAEKGDILITVKGAGVGKANVLALDKAVIGRQLMAIRPIVVNSDYIYLVILASYKAFQTLSIGSTVPGIGRKDILHFVVGLPPLEEQKRIIAKVNRLMKLCDELEVRLKDSYSHQEKLMEVAAVQLMQATAKTPALC